MNKGGYAMTYKYYMPTEVQTGRGITQKTGEWLKQYFQAKKVFIVTDKGIRNANLLTAIEDSLLRGSMEYTIFDAVEPNPSAETVHQGLEYLQAFQADVVLAIGGGSPIDAAKAIAAMATNSGHILDYEGVGKIINLPLPIVAIPTTSGTGSEVTAATVVTNKKTSFKAGIISPYLYPKLALLDPLLTIQLPPAVTAATGMDALTHAIESYTSKQTNPVSKGLAIEAIKMIGQNIRKAYFVGTDVESREKMLDASMLAGIAFAQSRLGNVHAISHTLGGVYDIPHGIANAALLPFVMRFNLPACPDQYADVAQALGKDISGLTVLEAGKKAIEAVEEFNQLFQIPNNIKDLGVSLDDVKKLVDDSMASGNVLINPRLTSAKDIEAILRMAYNGSVE
jgi:alcohol dehydrogenase class IV